MRRLAARAAPALFGIAVLLLWEAVVDLTGVPVYILPPPRLVLLSLWVDGPSLLGSLWITLRITLAALAAAAGLGLALALLMAQARWIERSLYPYLVILQVTPVVAIAPLIIIWANDVFLSLLICAWIVAFFPIVANTAFGLTSVDRGLVDLFRLYRADGWQTLFLLRLPAALPHFLAGLRISGGLALIGAVVAEFVAGTGGTESGLAFRIVESGYRLQIPKMFAALVMLSLTGIAIHAVLGIVAQRLLARWQEESSLR